MSVETLGMEFTAESETLGKLTIRLNKMKQPIRSRESYYWRHKERTGDRASAVGLRNIFKATVTEAALAEPERRHMTGKLST